MAGILFRFKSVRVYDAVSFDGTAMRLVGLKREIAEKAKPSRGRRTLAVLHNE